MTKQPPAPPNDWVAEGWPENHMLEAAWGLIANSFGGNWDEASSEWITAAERWRDQYHTAPEPDTRPPIAETLHEFSQAMSRYADAVVFQSADLTDARQNVHRLFVDAVFADKADA